MSDERWVLQDMNTEQFRAVRYLGVHCDPWVRHPSGAIQYVSKEVAELAGKYLHPLEPTKAMTYDAACVWWGLSVY